jgi:hypothetical protein
MSSMIRALFDDGLVETATGWGAFERERERD